MTDASNRPQPLETSPPSEISHEEFEAARQATSEAIEHIELVNVYPVSIHAAVTEDSSAGPSTSATLNVSVRHAAEPGAYGNRVQFSIALLDDDEHAVGEIDFELAVDYRVDEGYEVPESAANYIATTTGLFGAYPYARELAQSLSTRMQFDPLVLGLLQRSAIRPRSISRVPSRDVRAQNNQDEKAEASDEDE